MDSRGKHYSTLYKQVPHYFIRLEKRGQKYTPSMAEEDRESEAKLKR